MPVSVLELQRARRVLDRFCARRNALVPHSVARLCCHRDGDRLLIGDVSEVGNANDTGGFRALVQLSYQDGRWHMFWPLDGGDWRPYPHLPGVDNIQGVVEQLEQAPLHVHWG